MQLEFDEDKYIECVNAVCTALTHLNADQLSGALILLPILTQSIEDIEKANPDKPPGYTIMLQNLTTDLARLAQRYPELIFWKKNESSNNEPT